MSGLRKLGSVFAWERTVEQFHCQKLADAALVHNIDVSLSLALPAMMPLGPQIQPGADARASVALGLFASNSVLHVSID